MAARPGRWRVLAVFCGPSLDSAFADIGSNLGCVAEILEKPLSFVEGKVLDNDSLKTICDEIRTWQPNLLYICCGHCGGKRGDPGPGLSHLSFPPLNGKGPGSAEASLADCFRDGGVDTVYIDGLCNGRLADACTSLEDGGPAHLIHWRADDGPSAAFASQFGHVFFSSLRNPSTNVPEAFAVAQAAAPGFLASIQLKGRSGACVPSFVSVHEPAIPDTETIPLPVMEDLDFSNGIELVFPGWQNVCLIAPEVELRLLICGFPSSSDSEILSAICSAMRVILAMEMRQLKVPTFEQSKRLPGGLATGQTAVRCTIRSTSGASTSAVLAGPPEVLKSPPLVEHALRETLFLDAFKMRVSDPQAALPAPLARSSAAIAGGTPVHDGVIRSPLWAFSLLRRLAQDSSYRGLANLGIAAVDGASVAAFTRDDYARYKGLCEEPTDSCFPPGRVNGPIGPASVAVAYAPPVPARPHLIDGNLMFSAAEVGFSGRPIAVGPTGFLPFEPPHLTYPTRVHRWKSGRPALRLCTEEDFLDDLHLFLTERKVRQVPAREAFPDAILNGSKLDLFNLYKEVCQRGGIKMGNGINWKGQIFTNMSNYTSVNKMTGVGHALKRHYQIYLAEYEKAHPEDVRSDSCAVCGGGEEKATDWVGCDHCESWVHLSCDRRPGLGTFKDYATGEGRTYICPNCDKSKRMKK